MIILGSSFIKWAMLDISSAVGHTMNQHPGQSKACFLVFSSG